MRTTLTISINLDPVPGAMHTPESAATIVERVLADRLGHYRPAVEDTVSQTG